MKTIIINDLAIYLIQNGENVTVKVLLDKTVFANQNLLAIEDEIIEGIQSVFSFLNENATSNSCQIDKESLTFLSYSIAVYYLHMYNEWNNKYKNRKSLKVGLEELQSLNTFNLVVRFNKKQFLSDWQKHTMCLLAMNKEEFDLKLRNVNYFNDK